jgi:hypothetical protein
MTIRCNDCGGRIATESLESNYAASYARACAAYGVPVCPSGDGTGDCAIAMAEKLNVDVQTVPNAAG